MPNAVSTGPPALAKHFVHTLLRARDWQDRPEFAQLCDWWRGFSLSSSTEERVGVRSRSSALTPHSALRTSQSAGVCALVGIGGAGKTAIAEHFLRVLPGALPALPDTPKDDSLPPPGGLFVFSFYDAPNPDSFFAELSAWLTGTPLDDSAKPPSYQQTLQLLSRVAADVSPRQTPASVQKSSRVLTNAATLLLVLDGLEKVQDDGARGGAFGQILDGRLRDLILRAADGWLPGVALLITTRFRLFDPLAQRSALYRQIDIDRLQPPAALALSPSPIGWERVAEGRVRVDGYVSAFCDGDPARLPPLAEVKVPDEAAADDLRLAAVKEQERKFGRLAQRYREFLAAHDPAALALMERVCLFRLGVNADTLASIFTGEGKRLNKSGVTL